MKGIIKEKKYLILFFIIISLAFLSGCGGVTPTTPIISSFIANVYILDEGDSTILSWAVTDATTVNINQGIGSVALTSSTSISPVSSTTYTLTATNSAGSSTATVTITVIPAIIEQTITLQPGPAEGKDAYVFDNQPTWNYNMAYLYAGISSIWTTWRSYLQFDLSSLPSNAVIVDAKMGLFYYYQSGANTLNVALYKVQASWQEDNINWYNQPISSNIEEATIIIPDSPVNDFVYWQIDDLVRGWHDGSISNYGMLLRDNDESSNNGNVGFWSSDYNIGNQRPKLVINYYVP